MNIRNWMVVRVQKDGTLFVADQAYWTKNGAQAAATHLNNTFGAFETLANAMVGHNYWATPRHLLDAHRKVLEIAAREREKNRKA